MGLARREEGPPSLISQHSISSADARTGKDGHRTGRLAYSRIPAYQRSRQLHRGLGEAHLRRRFEGAEGEAVRPAPPYRPVRTGL